MNRAAGRLIVVAVAFVTVAALASVATAGPIKTPRGEYSGLTAEDREVTVSIAGKRVDHLSLAFDCHRTVGRTTLQDFGLTRSRHGYKFRIKAFGGVTYDDDESPENAPVLIAGTFTRGAKRVSGRLSVDAERCPTGKVEWTARRANAGP